MPVPAAPLRVSWRAGIDLNPLRVGDDEAMAWLRMLVWPEQRAREERLRTAITIARQDPPTLTTGNLLDLLPQQVEQVAEHGVVVVFHSAVIAYLGTEDRATFAALMSDLVAAGRCRWVSNEDPQVLPEVTRTAPALDDGTSPTFVLGIDGRAVARTHQHGASLRWLRSPS